MQVSTGDAVLVVVCSIVLLVHGSLAVMAHFQASRGRAALPSSSRARWRQRLLGWRKTMGEKDAEGEAESMARVVADMVRQTRPHFMRATIGTGSIIGMCGCAIMIVNVFTGHDGWLTRPPLLLSSAYFLLISFQHYCARDKWKMTSLVFSALSMLYIGLFGLLGPADVHVLVFGHFGFLYPLRLFVSVFCMDARLALPMNLMVSVSFGFALHRAEADMLPVRRTHIVIAEIFAVMGAYAFANTFQDVLTTSCRHAVTLKASKSESYAAGKVLHAMCDAAVRLDGLMRITAAETKLAALLMHGPDRPLTGSDFLQYFHEEEGRQSFREWLNESPEASGERTGFQSLLRDSTGAPIAVEMFNVPFETVSGALHHFVGIRETGPAEFADLVSESVYAPHISERQVPRSPRPVNNDRSPRGDSSRVADLVVEEVDSCPVFKFDAKTFQVLGHSAGFTIGAHGPPKTGSCLAHRLERCSDNDAFYTSFAENAQEVLRLARLTPDPVDVEYTTPMAFAPKDSSDKFAMSLRVKLASSWRFESDRGNPSKQPGVVATAVVLAMGRDSSGETAACSRSGPPGRRLEAISL